jgi:hypothetical protein
MWPRLTQNAARRRRFFQMLSITHISGDPRESRSSDLLNPMNRLWLFSDTRIARGVPAILSEERRGHGVEAANWIDREMA